ncbi:MAG TPA: aminotransferase class V-fold PLP-dependent enzyme [Gemmatimonadaceae bacterium]|jgi:selenocysteine lyase/cysteine desulfurase|nr:aminotransferase class V-fold PLP-dependent enzyme [Gemmatimonadaceae bacterium]
MPLSRRDFTRLMAVTGTTALLPHQTRAEWWPELSSAPLRSAGSTPDESYWREVRARFLVPPDVAFLNAANLCPMSLPVIEAIEKNTRTYEVNPSPEVRSGLIHAREDARQMLATALRCTPDELVLTRNTTEGNNFVSSGLDLGSRDEVVVSADNHPSNLNAWRQKATRFGFKVVTVDPPPAHPGTDGYVDLFTRAFTEKTKVLAVTHVSSNSGDVLPARELCRAARDRGIVSLLDGAQAFGALDVDLSAIKPDFFTGSMHKWPCGPKEKGVLFINRAAQERLHPSVYGVYGGATGISKTFEAEGQRDDAALAAVSKALEFQQTIGRDAIEQRVHQLAQHLMTELQKIDGVHLWTDPTPGRSAGIVVFKPGALDPRKLGAALTRERIVVTVRAGTGANAVNPGLRASPHFFNTMDDLDRFVATVGRYVRTGV